MPNNIDNKQFRKPLGILIIFTFLKNNYIFIYVATLPLVLNGAIGAFFNILVDSIFVVLFLTNIV